jgi:hypothetical protein
MSGDDGPARMDVRRDAIKPASVFVAEIIASMKTDTKKWNDLATRFTESGGSGTSRETKRSSSPPQPKTAAAADASTPAPKKELSAAATKRVKLDTERKEIEALKLKAQAEIDDMKNEYAIEAAKSAKKRDDEIERINAGEDESSSKLEKARRDLAHKRQVEREKLELKLEVARNTAEVDVLSSNAKREAADFIARSALDQRSGEEYRKAQLQRFLFEQKLSEDAQKAAKKQEAKLKEELGALQTQAVTAENKAELEKKKAALKVQLREVEAEAKHKSDVLATQRRSLIDEEKHKRDLKLIENQAAVDIAAYDREIKKNELTTRAKLAEMLTKNATKAERQSVADAANMKESGLMSLRAQRVAAKEARVRQLQAEEDRRRITGVGAKPVPYGLVSMSPMSKFICTLIDNKVVIPMDFKDQLVAAMDGLNTAHERAYDVLTSANGPGVAARWKIVEDQSEFDRALRVDPRRGRALEVLAGDNIPVDQTFPDNDDLAQMDEKDEDELSSQQLKERLNAATQRISALYSENVKLTAPKYMEPDATFKEAMRLTSDIISRLMIAFGESSGTNYLPVRLATADITAEDPWKFATVRMRRDDNSDEDYAVYMTTSLKRILHRVSGIRDERDIERTKAMRMGQANDLFSRVIQLMYANLGATAAELADLDGLIKNTAEDPLRPTALFSAVKAKADAIARQLPGFVFAQAKGPYSADLIWTSQDAFAFSCAMHDELWATAIAATNFSLTLLVRHLGLAPLLDTRTNALVVTGELLFNEKITSRVHELDLTFLPLDFDLAAEIERTAPKFAREIAELYRWYLEERNNQQHFTDFQLQILAKMPQRRSDTPSDATLRRDTLYGKSGRDANWWMYLADGDPLMIPPPSWRIATGAMYRAGRPWIDSVSPLFGEEGSLELMSFAGQIMDRHNSVYDTAHHA